MQTNKTTNAILGIIAIALIALVVISITRKNDAPVLGSQEPIAPVDIVSPTPVKPVAPVTQAAPVAPVTTVPPVPQNPNLVTKSAWSISFVKTSDWIVTGSTNGEVDLKAVSGESKDDSIVMQYVAGNSVTDTDAKFGNITYYYDTPSQSWMVRLPDEQNGGSMAPSVAVPVAHTASGLPIFSGTGRWLTYIIPLSHTTFLRLNIGGGGFSQPLKDLAATIRSL